jgi:hypothetical protein
MRYRYNPSDVVNDNVLYHSLSGSASRPLGCSRKMCPLAFLDPSAFIGTIW